ncbi:MAG: DUF1905 domain-containing protein [Caenibius sp.]
MRFTAPLWRWTGGNGGSWHFVTAGGAAAEAIAAHALIRRLEEGHARGFGSVKVEARIGDSCWTTSVFPHSEGGWILPVKARSGARGRWPRAMWRRSASRLLRAPFRCGSACATASAGAQGADNPGSARDPASRSTS